LTSFGQTLLCPTAALPVIVCRVLLSQPRMETLSGRNAVALTEKLSSWSVPRSRLTVEDVCGALKCSSWPGPTHQSKPSRSARALRSSKSLWTCVTVGNCVVVAVTCGVSFALSAMRLTRSDEEIFVSPATVERRVSRCARSWAVTTNSLTAATRPAKRCFAPAPVDAS
jgi:hypothetical protein